MIILWYHMNVQTSNNCQVQIQMIQIHTFVLRFLMLCYDAIHCATLFPEEPHTYAEVCIWWCQSEVPEQYANGYQSWNQAGFRCKTNRRWTISGWTTCSGSWCSICEATQVLCWFAWWVFTEAMDSRYWAFQLQNDILILWSMFLHIA